MFGGKQPKAATQLGSGGLGDTRPTGQVEFLFLCKGKHIFGTETSVTDVAKWSELLFWDGRLRKNETQHAHGTSGIFLKEE